MTAHSKTASVPALLTSVVAAIAFLAALTVHAVHMRMPHAEPEVTVGAAFSDVEAGNLEGFAASASRQFYVRFVRHFGGEKYQRVQAIFDQMQALGYPRWLQIQQRGMAGAAKAYDDLHSRVVELGREEFAKLTVDQRLDLIDRRQTDAFYIEAGLRALPAEQRALLSDPASFRTGRDRDDFATRNAWTYSQPNDKAALGSPAALSADTTPEKTAFLDRAGQPLLASAAVAELGDIKRDELANVPAFEFNRGEPLARDYLNKKLFLGLANPVSCLFPRTESQGSLMRGVEASCSVAINVKGRRGAVRLNLDLRKVGTNWLIDVMAPDLYDIAR